MHPSEPLIQQGLSYLEPLTFITFHESSSPLRVILTARVFPRLKHALNQREKGSFQKKVNDIMRLLRLLIGIGFIVTGSAFQIPLRPHRVDIRVSSNKKDDEGRKTSMPLTELSRRQEAAGNMRQLATPYLLGETINKAAILFIGFWFLLDLLGYGLVNDGTGLRIDTKEVAEMQRQINKTKPR